MAGVWKNISSKTDLGHGNGNGCKSYLILYMLLSKLLD